MTTINDLLRARFGIESRTGTDTPAEGTVAQILNRRSHRRYTDRPVDPDLLETLLACAQSAPAKSDLQQYSIIVVDDRDLHARITSLSRNLDFVAKAPLLLLFCADLRRMRRIAVMRGHSYANDNLDTFMNGAVDAALAMQSFIIAAESVGLGCCPLSVVRNHIEAITEMLGLPEAVYPISGLSVGWPSTPGFLSQRLPPAAVVHRNRYDDSDLEALVEGYDRRRHAIFPVPPEKQTHADKYGALDYCPWSENKARQLSLPERAGFRAFLKNRGMEIE